MRTYMLWATTQKTTKPCSLLFCIKTNGVSIPGKQHWHCVCESSLGSETLWIHAGSQGAILDQSICQFGRLHSGSCCLPYTPLLGAHCIVGTGQILLRLKYWNWHRYNVWSKHQRLRETCLMEICGVSSPEGNFIVFNITFSFCYHRVGEKQIIQ